MTVNGLWTAEFTTGTGVGTGVVVFVNGQIMGGDNHYYYKGSYKEDGPRLLGELLVKHYAGALTNVFGELRELRLVFSGSASSDYIIATGSDPSSPLRRLSVKLQRVHPV